MHLEHRTIHLRRCIASREMLPKQALLRFCVTDRGFTLDLTQKGSGRGAWIQPKRGLLALAVKKHLFRKVMRLNSLALSSTLCDDVLLLLVERCIEYYSRIDINRMLTLIGDEAKSLVYEAAAMHDKTMICSAITQCYNRHLIHRDLATSRALASVLDPLTALAGHAKRSTHLCAYHNQYGLIQRFVYALKAMLSYGGMEEFLTQPNCDYVLPQNAKSAYAVSKGPF